MKKRKPYTNYGGLKSRVLHGPPGGWQDQAKPGWLLMTGWHGYGFVSLWGQVKWHSRSATWYGYVRPMRHGPWVRGEPIGGFSRVREAMSWVESAYNVRDRKRGWKAVLE